MGEATVRLPDTRAMNTVAARVQGILCGQRRGRAVFARHSGTHRAPLAFVRADPARPGLVTWIGRGADRGARRSCAQATATGGGPATDRCSGTGGTGSPTGSVGARAR